MRDMITTSEVTMTDVSTTRSGSTYPGVWAIVSLMATVALASRVVLSIVTGYVHLPFMSTIRVMESPYTFYGILIALALFAGLCVVGSLSYWQEWKVKRQHGKS